MVRESRRRESERLSPSESPFYLTLTAELAFHKVSRTCQVVTISCCNVHAENQDVQDPGQRPFYFSRVELALRAEKKGLWFLGFTCALCLCNSECITFLFFFREIRSLRLKNGQYKDLLRTMILVGGFLSAVLQTFIFELRSTGKTFFWGRAGFWLQYLKRPLEKLAARPCLQLSTSVTRVLPVYICKQRRGNNWI